MSVLPFLRDAAGPRRGRKRQRGAEEAAAADGCQGKDHRARRRSRKEAAAAAAAAATEAVAGAGGGHQQQEERGQSQQLEPAPKKAMEPSPAGPQAALVLADWLGNALVDHGSSGSSPTTSHVVRALGLLLRAEAAMPRHAALLAAQLDGGKDDEESGRHLRLEAVNALAALPPPLAAPFLPALARRVADRCELVRAAALQALGSPGLLDAARRYVPRVIAGLEDVSRHARRAAWEAVHRMGHAQTTQVEGTGGGSDAAATYLAPEDVEAIAAKLGSRSSPIREAALRALGGLLPPASTTQPSGEVEQQQHPAFQGRYGRALLDAQGAVATLLQRDGSPAVRALAVDFLGRLPEAHALRHVAAVLPRLGDPRPEVQTLAFAFLARLPRQEVGEAARRRVRELVALLRGGAGEGEGEAGDGNDGSSSSGSSSDDDDDEGEEGSRGRRRRRRRTRLLVLRALATFVPSPALEPYVGDIVACAGWRKQQQEEDEDKREVIAVGGRSGGVLRQHLLLLGRAPRKAQEAQINASGGSSSSSKEKGKMADEEIGEAVLELLGKARTSVALPHVDAAVASHLLPRLLPPPRPTAPGAADAQVAAAAAAAVERVKASLLSRVRNPEIRRQCLARLVATAAAAASGSDSSSSGSSSGGSRRQVLALLSALAAAAEAPALHLHQHHGFVAACLAAAGPAGLRREALSLLLALVAAKPLLACEHAGAIAAALGSETEEALGEWLLAGAEEEEGGKQQRRKALALVAEAVEEKEEEKEEGDGKENVGRGQRVAHDVVKQLRRLLRREKGEEEAKGKTVVVDVVGGKKEKLKRD